TRLQATGEKTVVLATTSSRQLPGYVQSAEALQLPAYLVRDAGRTEWLKKREATLQSQR
ncbi:hypothetical protein WJX84_003853, partial [Apatococcus fuscideae]